MFSFFLFFFLLPTSTPFVCREVKGKSDRLLDSVGKVLRNSFPLPLSFSLSFFSAILNSLFLT